MNNIQKVEEYIYDFLAIRIEGYCNFYKSVEYAPQLGVYKLKDGDQIRDMINSIYENILNNYYSEKLIPNRFATPQALFSSLNGFKEYLIKREYLLNQNLRGEDTSFEILKVIEIKTELIQMIDYARELYDTDDNVIPYKDLRHSLITKNLPNFIRALKSILASVPYAIAKTKEGYHHSNIHLILKLLGFDIISEEITNVGRIDAVIRFIDRVYIMEFKLGNSEDLSGEALSQIKEMGYPDKFYVEGKEVIAIGVSFCEKNRNINFYKDEVIVF